MGGATSMIIDGQALAQRFLQRLAALNRDFIAQYPPPGLATILVGEHPASRVYVERKASTARSIGMHSVTIALHANIDTEDLLIAVQRLNADRSIHGFLIQLPLPAHIDLYAVIDTINPRKDADGFHPHNSGRLLQGRADLVPCTPLGCMALLNSINLQLRGKHVLVIGRSHIVGKPLAQLLLQADCTVTTAHAQTFDLSSWCRQADIVIAAAGRPHLVQGGWIKPGAVVIDVGINRVAGKLLGDVDFDAAKQVASAITPVPGGVGPMTIACLLYNCFCSACRSYQISPPSIESLLT